MPKYLLFPVNDALPKATFFVKAGGKTVSDFTAAYAPENPRFDAYVDVTRFGDCIITDGAGNPLPLKSADRLPTIDEIPGGDVLRPAVHYTATLGWTNDPNGLIYADGTYHMFAQHNPMSTDWGNMTWDHAVSDDLLHWTDLGDVLFPDETGTMFSGSAVSDERNVAGFGAGAILLFYTAAGDHSELSRSVPFTQCLAYSTDGGKTFVMYAGNPVIPHIVGANRDPKVQWSDELGKYTLSLYLDGSRYAIFSSDDLLRWTRICDVDMPLDNECPDFYPLPVDGSVKWVFSGAHDSYLIGEIRDCTFVPEQEPLPYHIHPGPSYAAQTFSGTGERRIKIAWDNIAAPGAVFHSQMGFPAEMFLRRIGDKIRLGSLPVREIESIRTPSAHIRRSNVSGTVNVIDPLPDAAEVCLSFGEDCGDFTLSCYGMKIEIRPEANTIKVGDAAAPLTYSGERNLRVIFDTLGAEIFADGGLIYMTLGQTADKTQGVAIEGNVMNLTADVYQLKL
ncbi:MAG: glycoside hydrolase family 32 protein [Clostridia bacterium]|nr:glycoside hydrolase family 32 protein [Clostridia bacterium]